MGKKKTYVKERRSYGMTKKKTAKQIITQHVKDTGRILELDYDDFAYFDEKVNRWRAGKLCSTRKAGSFLTASHAQRIRASVSTSVQASKQAIRIAMQKDVSNKEAVKLGYQWVKEYRKAKREFKIKGVPSPRKMAFVYVDEIFNIEES